MLASWAALSSDSITFKEMLPIVWALALWEPLWKNASVTVYCDSLGAVGGVNSGYSKIPRIMHLLRCLFFLWAQFNIELIALHVPGGDNCLANCPFSTYRWQQPTTLDASSSKKQCPSYWINSRTGRPTTGGHCSGPVFRRPRSIHTNLSDWF